MEKTSVKKWLRLSVILYIVILSVVAVSTFAWFVFEKTVALESATEMQITAGNKLEIILMDDEWAEIESGDWRSNIDITMDGDTMYPDISSKDGQIFYYPKALNNGEAPEKEDFYDVIVHNGVLHGNDIETSSEVRSQYYVTVNLKFRTAQPMSVYLADGSAIDPVILEYPDSATDGEKTEIDQQNACNKALAGMVRVAFLEATIPEKDSADVDNTYVTKNIWIPNDTYELIANNPSEGGGISDHVTFTVEESGEREEAYYYLFKDTVQGNIQKNLWVDDDYLSKKVTVGGSKLAYADKDGELPMIMESCPLLNFTQDDIDAGEGLAEKCLSIRIWFEGTDREAHSALLESQINYKFKFCGIQKEENPKNQDVSYSNGKLIYKDNSSEVPADVMEWSLNGIDWNPYTPQTFTQGTNQDLLNGVSSIFVRYLEGNTYKASAPKRVIIATSPAS